MSTSRNAVHPIDVSGLLCFWDFQEEAGQERVAQGAYAYRLRPWAAPVERVGDGVFGSYSARIRPGHAFVLPRAQCPALDIHGPHAQVTLVAWIKREKADNDQCQAIAGMWNEHGLRQYCLFLNLRIHDSHQQVGAHVSAIGSATPGFRYCMDAAIGQTPVPMGVWQCVALVYDGAWARAYLNGRLDERGARNPYLYEGGIFDAGTGGADFTVGAVPRPERVDENRVPHGSVIANNYHGLLGGLAVFDRALSPDELAALSECLSR